MLHKIRAKGGASSNTRCNSGSTSAFNLVVNTPIFEALLTISKQRPEQNEVSLAIVPRDHPLIPPPNLEAEATGLLDRLLNVFYENSRYVLQIVDHRSIA